MSERGELKIRQIVVESPSGELCAVSLPPDRMDYLVAFISTLSEGPIKLVRLPGVKMIPIEDLEA
ncbi:hypothetical protein M527_06640 [Sphingobium indicum IP26]|uniref:Uncharacterized protein n=1 Tax=Sphingobium indicum F2 TaxID=1450518 RepID=A0A8E1C3G5_9SPHN|nr:hypothetical protein [Sphingobium indicum]EPR09801.1 hypothetical protein M527_06640 [Sphingobium indicum IP26]KER37252.1 hypothetical protein AL00_06145 [Sphingobium indicum F2]